MNVNLTPELDRLVREKVESGMYGSASEVVREALRRMLGPSSPSLAREPGMTYQTAASAEERRRTTAWIRERQAASGHVPPTKEEVDDYIRKIREGWDH